MVSMQWKLLFRCQHFTLDRSITCSAFVHNNLNMLSSSSTSPSADAISTKSVQECDMSKELSTDEKELEICHRHKTGW